LETRVVSVVVAEQFDMQAPMPPSNHDFILEDDKVLSLELISNHSSLLFLYLSLSSLFVQKHHGATLALSPNMAMNVELPTNIFENVEVTICRMMMMMMMRV